MHETVLALAIGPKCSQQFLSLEKLIDPDDACDVSEKLEQAEFPLLRVLVRYKGGVFVMRGGPKFFST